MGREWINGLHAVISGRKFGKGFTVSFGVVAVFMQEIIVPVVFVVATGLVNMIMDSPCTAGSITLIVDQGTSLAPPPT